VLDCVKINLSSGMGTLPFGIFIRKLESLGAVLRLCTFLFIIRNLKFSLILGIFDGHFVGICISSSGSSFLCTMGTFFSVFRVTLKTSVYFYLSAVTRLFSLCV